MTVWDMHVFRLLFHLGLALLRWVFVVILAKGELFWD